MKKASLIKVAAGLIIREGRYLITKRLPDVHYGGYWEFPGGKCKAQESLEVCLKRELREELGVEIVELKPYHQLQHDYPDTTVELSFFTCAIKSGEPRALGCQELRWVAPEALPDYDFPPADVSLIEMIQGEQSKISGIRNEG